MRNHSSVLIVIKSTQINQLIEDMLRLTVNKFMSALYAKIGNSKYGILTGKLHTLKMIHFSKNVKIYKERKQVQNMIHCMFTDYI